MINSYIKLYFAIYKLSKIKIIRHKIKNLCNITSVAQNFLFLNELSTKYSFKENL